MKRTINVHEFRDAFRDYGRDDSFSYNGLGALFDWLEELEDDWGEDIELDVIGLCCDFSEHDSALECIKDLGYDGPDAGEEDDTEEDRESLALQWLYDRTTVIEFDGGIIVQGF